MRSISRTIRSSKDQFWKWSCSDLFWENRFEAQYKKLPKRPLFSDHGAQLTNKNVFKTLIINKWPNWTSTRFNLWSENNNVWSCARSLRKIGSLKSLVSRQTGHTLPYSRACEPLIVPCLHECLIPNNEKRFCVFPCTYLPTYSLRTSTTQSFVLHFKFWKKITFSTL